MNADEREAIFDQLLTALECALDACASANRDERLPVIDTFCRRAAEHAAELLQTRRAGNI